MNPLLVQNLSSPEKVVLTFAGLFDLQKTLTIVLPKQGSLLTTLKRLKPAFSR